MRLTRILYAGARAVVKTAVKASKKTETLPPAKNAGKNHSNAKPQAQKKLSPSPLAAHLSPSSDLTTLLQNTVPSDEEQDASDHTAFSGRVHSESYSVDNLSAAFHSLLASSSSSSSTPNPYSLINSDRQDTNNPTQVFLSAIKNSTLTTLEKYRSSIIESLGKDDPNGRVYSTNVRQMKDILGFEKWRKKLELTLQLTSNNDTPLTTTNTKQKPPSSSSTKSKSPSKERTTKISSTLHKSLPPLSAFSTRKELLERPTISDPEVTEKLIKEFWNLDKLIDATVVVSYSGFPTLVDELLKLKNIKKVIAIEEKPEYCIMCTDRWQEEVINNRLFHIKNDGYWWESYSEVEEGGLLDDVAIEPWEKPHPSLFFICQLPHNKRSLQFIMQLMSFIPNRNWLFQYGRVRLGFIGSGDISQRLTREITEKKYTRITAAANCLATIEKPPESIAALKPDQLFPTNFNLDPTSAISNLNDVKSISIDKKLIRKKKSIIPKKIYKSSPEANPPPFASALHFIPKGDLNLSPEEFECMTFLQKAMFVHSAQSWVESISHAAAGASIMYEKLKEIDRKNRSEVSSSSSSTLVEVYSIPKSKTPRSFSHTDWIHLAKAFNKWPFRPHSFENDLELDADDGSTV